MMNDVVENLIIGVTIALIVAMALGAALVADHNDEMTRAYRRLSWQLCKQAQGQIVVDEFGFPTCEPRAKATP